MKNIEKYPNTRDAMEAFREWYNDHKHSVLTMSEWLEKDYDHHPQTTLLESAESVIKEWRRPNFVLDARFTTEIQGRAFTGSCRGRTRKEARND